MIIFLELIRLLFGFVIFTCTYAILDVWIDLPGSAVIYNLDSAEQSTMKLYILPLFVFVSFYLIIRIVLKRKEKANLSVQSSCKK